MQVVFRTQVSCNDGRLSTSQEVANVVMRSARRPDSVSGRGAENSYHMPLPRQLAMEGPTLSPRRRRSSAGCLVLQNFRLQAKILQVLGLWLGHRASRTLYTVRVPCSAGAKRRSATRWGDCSSQWLRGPQKSHSSNALGAEVQIGACNEQASE